MTTEDTIRTIVKNLRRLDRLEPDTALANVDVLVREAIALRTEPKPARTLDVRLKAVHPGCTGGFIQQPPHSGRRSWKCGGCGQFVTLPEGGR